MVIESDLPSPPQIWFSSSQSNFSRAEGESASALPLFSLFCEQMRNFKLWSCQACSFGAGVSSSWSFPYSSLTPSFPSPRFPHKPDPAHVVLAVAGRPRATWCLLQIIQDPPLYMSSTSVSWGVVYHVQHGFQVSWNGHHVPWPCIYHVLCVGQLQTQRQHKGSDGFYD